MLNRNTTEDLIPHAGNMVLLDSVISWDSSSITCTTLQHRSSDNPLRHNGILPASASIEFAGQAMALHRALNSDKSPRQGVLASLRVVEFICRRLDEIVGVIDINAKLISASAKGSAYDFQLTAAGKKLVFGRATVFLL